MYGKCKHLLLFNIDTILWETNSLTEIQASNYSLRSYACRLVCQGCLSEFEVHLDREIQLLAADGLLY